MFFPYISALIVLGLMFLGTTNIALSQTQEPSPQIDTVNKTSQGTTVNEASQGTTQIEFRPPSGFSRIDGVGSDIGEILTLCRPKRIREKAIFSDPRAWKRFFSEIYGNNPIDLGFYADLTVGSDSSSYPQDIRGLKGYFPNLLVIKSVEKPIDDSDMSSQFIEVGQSAATPFELVESGPGYLTFKTTLGLMERDEEGELIFKSRYHMIGSVIEVNGELLGLNLYHTEKGSLPEKARELALDWRDEYLGIIKDLSQPPKTREEIVPAPQPQPQPEAGNISNGNTTPLNKQSSTLVAPLTPQKPDT